MIDEARTLMREVMSEVERRWSDVKTITDEGDVALVFARPDERDATVAAYVNAFRSDVCWGRVARIPRVDSALIRGWEAPPPDGERRVLLVAGRAVWPLAWREGRFRIDVPDEMRPSAQAIVEALS